MRLTRLLRLGSRVISWQAGRVLDDVRSGTGSVSSTAVRRRSVGVLAPQYWVSVTGSDAEQAEMRTMLMTINTRHRRVAIEMRTGISH